MKSISSDFTVDQASPHIDKYLSLPPTYSGYIEVKTNVNLGNKGFYDIKNLKVAIAVYAYNWSVSTKHNGDQVGTGTNKFGTITSGSSYAGSISLSVTKDIPNLAIENCDSKIDDTVHLVYDPLIDIPFSYSTTIYQAERCKISLQE